jgi:hypothetical protein
MNQIVLLALMASMKMKWVSVVKQALVKRMTIASYAKEASGQLIWDAPRIVNSATKAHTTTKKIKLNVKCVLLESII